MAGDTEDARFWPKVAVGFGEDDCWLWTASLDPKGYGRFRWSRGMTAHRWSYERFVGPVPDGLQLDHLCRVRHCVNPAHLEAVTTQENTRRGNSGLHERQKTHCPQGHPYDENYRDARGRICRTCRRAGERARAARRRSTV